MRKLIRMTTIFLLLAPLLAPKAHGSGRPGFPDLDGHWAAPAVRQAVAAGYVSGYPDGTFRPDAPVTRAEVIKLLVVAGRIELYPDHSPGYLDMYGEKPHWVLVQGYLNTAGASGIFPESERTFRPDEPATRMDVLTWALGLLGRPYSDPPEPAELLPFTDEIPAARSRWVKMGLDLGLVTGYPDGTFRPDGRITRAEAVVFVQRTLARMEAGTDPNLTLVVDGKPVPGAVLSVRDGIVFAPAQALYPTVRDPQSWQEPQAYTLFPANERYVSLYESLVTAAGDPKALLTARGTAVTEKEWPARPYIRFGRLMLPVAPVGGTASIPYGSARHDATAGTVTVTHGADWPGYLLPTRPDQLRMFLPVGHVIGPGFRADLRIPLLTDAQGNLFRDKQMPPVTFTLNPASPIRFPDGATTFTATAANGWQVPEPVLLPDAAAGTYSLRISADGYDPLDQEIRVVN